MHFLESCVAEIADLIGSVSISAPKINPLNAAEAVLAVSKIVVPTRICSSNILQTLQMGHIFSLALQV